jgi:mono/diheme cytochrome c family protein
MTKLLYQAFYVAIIAISFFSCKKSDPNVDLDLTEFELEEGLTLQCVAKEPLVIAPVSLVFDEEGVAWTIEMKSYMSDIDGLGENAPICRIKKLYDKNGDGVYDEYTIFLDSLVLPRSVLPVYGGVLVAIPPSLWFYDKNGKNRQLVDSTYAVGGNAEHQANSLLKGIDNWIYSAKSSKRYKKKGGTWIIDNTRFRGQWGIDQDDFGRLYYNHNGIVMTSEVLAPNIISIQSYALYPSLDKIIPDIQNNDRLYPLTMNGGLNRAYQEGTLDTLGRLVNCTSCCGVSVLGSDQLGTKYNGNIFIAETAGNLVKRLVIKDQKNGQQNVINDYTEKEFLRSKSEIFRPVFTTTGIDGNLYIVDMRKGVIQHVTYLTNHLRNHIIKNKLDTINNQGRIYKVFNKQNKPKLVKLNNLPDEKLVDLLNSDNKSVRILAQWKIINENMSHLSKSLSNLYMSTNNDYAKFHVLYTLEGLSINDSTIVKNAGSSTNPHLRRLGIQLAFQSNVYNSIDQSRLDTLDQYVYASALAGQITINENLKSSTLSNKFVNKISTDTVLSAVFAGKILEYGDKEKSKDILNKLTNKNSILSKYLKDSPNTTKQNTISVNHLNLTEKEMFYSGESNYKKHCVGCHNIDGKGVPTLAPSLVNSKIVLNQDKSILIKTVLYGIEVKVGPNAQYGASMTGLVDNEEINNGSIAAILTYIRNSWGNKNTAVSTNEVSIVRKNCQ